MSLKVKYNGYMLSDAFIVSEIKRSSPDFRTTSTVINGKHGESFNDATIGTREVSFQLVFAAANRYTIQDAARILFDVLMTRTPKKLVFSDEKTREDKQLVRYAVPLGTFDVEEFIRAGRWTCRFIQHDPFLYYDSDSNSVTLKAKVPEKVAIGGNAPTYLVVRAKPSNGTKNFWIKNHTTNQAVYFKANFDGTAIITLDFETGKATLTNSDGLDWTKVDGLLTKSRFFTVGGTETITSKADKIKLEASCKCDISWRERWL